MTALDRRQLLLGGTLLGAAAATGAMRPQRPVAATVRLAPLVPLRIGAYAYASSTGLIVPEPDEVAERTYDDVLTRVYVAAERPAVMLMIAYGSAQTGAVAVHRPEGCYQAAGYRLRAQETVALAGGPPGAGATRWSAISPDGVEQVYFWTRIGALFPTSPWREKFDVLAANLRGELPDGVLVRLSMRIADRDAAQAQLTAFNRMLLAAMPPAGRRLLLGDGASA